MTESQYEELDGLIDPGIPARRDEDEHAYYYDEMDEMDQVPKKAATIPAEKKFEEESMFNPGQGSNDSEQEELDADSDAAGGSEANASTYKLGHPDLYRQSNENIYNIRHASHGKHGPLGPAPLLRTYKAMAQQMTELRREQFKRVQKEQFSLPAELRVPHYLDKNGELKAYSQEEIE